MRQEEGVTVTTAWPKEEPKGRWCCLPGGDSPADHRDDQEYLTELEYYVRIFTVKAEDMAGFAPLCMRPWKAWDIPAPSAGRNPGKAGGKRRCGTKSIFEEEKHMAKKRAATGFKSMALAPVTENTLTSYKTGPAEPLQFAGQMTRTAKESSTDLYYDDTLYAQIKDVTGEEVEIRVAEVPLEQMADFGLGTFDEDTQTLEGDFSPPNKEYALRFVVDTVDSLPFYFNYRVFEMTGIKFDNFTTKKDSPHCLRGDHHRGVQAACCPPCPLGGDAAGRGQEQRGGLRGVSERGGDEARGVRARKGQNTGAGV